jgi:hypothetical protein
MPSILAKLNCFFAGTFVYGVVFAYALSWVLVSFLPRGTPEIAVVVASFLPFVAAGALMAKRWKANTLFPDYVEPEYSTRYFIGQFLVLVCNAAVVAAIVIRWSVKTQADTAGALGFVYGLTLLLPGFLMGMLGLKMVSDARPKIWQRMNGQVVANKEKRTEFASVGSLIQALGLIAPLVLGALFGTIGMVIGVPLLLVLYLLGLAKATKWFCGNCKNPLASKEVSMCVACKARLE